MTADSLTTQASGPIDSLLTQVASRVTLSAASRITVGNLTVRLPDGSTRVFGDRDSELQGEMHIHDLEALHAAATLDLGGAGRGPALGAVEDQYTGFDIARAGRTAGGYAAVIADHAIDIRAQARHIDNHAASEAVADGRQPAGVNARLLFEHVQPGHGPLQPSVYVAIDRFHPGGGLFRILDPQPAGPILLGQVVGEGLDVFLDPEFLVEFDRVPEV